MNKFILSFILILVNITSIMSQNTCATAIVINQTSLPYASGALSTCGTVNNYGVGGAGCNTTYGGGEDYVYQLNITTAPATYNFSLGGAATYKICQIFTGCPSPVGAPTNCLGNITTGAGTTASGNFTFPSVGTYYIVIDTWPAPACGTFTLGINLPPTCPSALGSYTSIASFPYTNAATTCGQANNLTSTNASAICGSASYYNEEDAIYTFTPSTTGLITIDLATASTWSGLMLYNGCPFNGGTCVANSQSSLGPKTMCATVTAGVPYTLVLDSWVGTGCLGAYTINISSCSAAPPGGAATAAASTVCASGNTLALSVTGSSTGTCSNTYQWQSAPIAAGPWTNVAGTAVGYTASVTGATCYRRLTTCAAGTGTSTAFCVTIATCTAPTGGNAVATPTAACAAGGTVALSATGGSSGCGYTYQWQSAPAAAGPWTNIAGATFSTAAGTVNSPSTCFRRIITCGASSATSAAVCVAPGGSCASQLGTGVVNIASLPYSSGAGTTCGAGNNLTTANVSTSGCSSSSYLTGEDQVFIFTPTASGNITINLTSGGTYTGLMLYSTCPMTCSGSGGCVGSSTSSTGNKALTVCVIAGTTYYLILDSFSAPACNAYSNLTISAPGSTATTNDFCNSPTPLSAGGTFTGATNGMTPDQPGNFSSIFCGSTENNQWFSFVATATTHTFGFSAISGTNCPWGIQGQVMAVATTPTPCMSCTSFTNQSTPCYNPATTASGTLTASPLTVGQTYYLVVDGNAGSACNFTINGWTIPVLPVDLVYFRGIGLDNKTNKLEWMTVSETNFNYYQIQRSIDGKTFSDLDQVYPSGPSNVQKTYSYYDKSFTQNINYYRLKIVDKDGTFRYSSLVAINSDPNGKFTINKIFPNPANKEIYMSVDVPTDTEVEYEVLDVTGRLIIRNKQYMSMGTGLLNVNLESLNKGIYYLKFNCNNETKVEKFSLQ